MAALTEVLTPDVRSIRLGDSVGEVFQRDGEVRVGRIGVVVELIDANTVAVVFPGCGRRACYAAYLAVLPRRVAAW